MAGPARSRIENLNVLPTSSKKAYISVFKPFPRQHIASFILHHVNHENAKRLERPPVPSPSVLRIGGIASTAAPRSGAKGASFSRRAGADGLESPNFQTSPKPPPNRPACAIYIQLLGFSVIECFKNFVNFFCSFLFYTLFQCYHLFLATAQGACLRSHRGSCRC